MSQRLGSRHADRRSGSIAQIRLQRRGVDRHYTGEFAGTSSASPIVAGAAVLLESYARSRSRGPLPAADIRALLRATGTPQTGAAREPIGPRPDLAPAFDAIDR
jgi:hypothetical protein